MSTAIEPDSQQARSHAPHRLSLLGRAAVRFATYARCARKLGLGATLALMRAHAERRAARKATRPGEPRAIRIKGYPHPVYFRPGSSDLYVVLQIFEKEEYACVADEEAVRFIVDCGANAGYSAVYLLNKYPRARLVAVEPDAGNAGICRRNLAPYGDRVEVIEAGVWPRDARLKVERGVYRDGLEWSYTVRPARDDEPHDIDAVGLPTLLDRNPEGRIDLLKVDIERAERELFAEGTDAWLTRVGTLAIELHDDECRAAFLGAITPLGFATRESGELTIARRPDPASSP